MTFLVLVYPFQDGGVQIYAFATREEAQAFIDGVAGLPEDDVAYLGAGSDLSIYELEVTTPTEALVNLSEYYNVEKE